MLFQNFPVQPLAVPGLAFGRSEAATIFNCTCIGLQAEWLAQTLASKSKLQKDDLNPDAMVAEVHAFQSLAHSWMPPTLSRSALVLLHQALERHGREAVSLTWWLNT